MKNLNQKTCGLGLVLSLGAGAIMVANTGFAITENNPYSPIVGRNVFALRPPTPVVNTPTTPVVPPSSIELQGITTILGRPQVLLKIKSPAKPPAPASDQSFVLDVGQREGEVEVVGIDMLAGIVRLKNQGSDLALNMADDAAKPAAGPVLPGATVPPSSKTPGMIPPPLPAAGGRTATQRSNQGNQPTLPTLPSRALRSGSGNNTPQAPISAEHQGALMEVERERTRDLVREGKYPPLPPLPGMSPTTPE